MFHTSRLYIFVCVCVCVCVLSLCQHQIKENKWQNRNKKKQRTHTQSKPKWKCWKYLAIVVLALTFHFRQAKKRGANNNTHTHTQSKWNEEIPKRKIINVSALTQMVFIISWYEYKWINGKQQKAAAKLSIQKNDNDLSIILSIFNTHAASAEWWRRNGEI